MRRDEPAIGLWVASDSDDAWPGGPYFDSRDECLQHAQVEFDAPVFLGRISIVCTDELVADILLRHDAEADEILADAHEVLTDDYIVEIPPAVRCEMVSAVAAILRDRHCVTHWFQVGGVECIGNLEDTKP